MHVPKEVITSECVDLVYDQVLFTDLEVGANRPDILIKDKAAKKTYLIDVSCPCDINIHKMEATKVAKYIGLKGQLQKLYGFDCMIIPVIINLQPQRSSCKDSGMPKHYHVPKDYAAGLETDSQRRSIKKSLITGPSHRSRQLHGLPL